MLALLDFLAVGLGGALGAALRYAAGLVADKLVPQGHWLGSFPAPTLAVNVLGCFAIGFASVLFTGFEQTHRPWKLFATTGLLGGFTTFSTFSLEAITLGETGGILPAAAYAGATLAFCLCAAALGRVVGHATFGR